MQSLALVGAQTEGVKPRYVSGGHRVSDLRAPRVRPSIPEPPFRGCCRVSSNERMADSVMSITPRGLLVGNLKRRNMPRA